MFNTRTRKEARVIALRSRASSSQEALVEINDQPIYMAFPIAITRYIQSEFSQSIRALAEPCDWLIGSTNPAT